MNANCYKIIFSKRLGTLVAVGEHTSSTGKAASGQGCRGSVVADGFVGALRFTFASVALACLLLGNTQAQSSSIASTALPQGSSVSTGSATISTQGAAMAITQSTDKASINWQSFNVGTGASVNIAQPSADAVLLNRVVGNDPSQILGKLSANGQVILLNPNGVLFGKDGSVTASAFTASTFGLSDADFMAGYYKYNRNGSTAAVVNQGTIETSAGGFVALIGATVTNEGTIHAPQGDVVMAAAESVTLPEELVKPQPVTTPNTVSVRMSKRVRLELDPAAINTAVNNTESGVILTEGGQVLLQAAAISSAVASVTHSGRIDTSAPQAGAVTVLADNGDIKVNGSIKSNSSGTDSQGHARTGGDIIIGRDEETGALARAADVSDAMLESQGGFVETSGKHLATNGTTVKAKDWLLDPTSINIVVSDTGTPNTASSTTGNTKTFQDQTQNGSPSTDTSEVLKSTLEAAINAGTSVTISTANPYSSGTGDITISTALSFNNTGGQDATLRLYAVNGITQNSGASITATGSKLVNVEMVAEGRYAGIAVAAGVSDTNSKGITLNSSIRTNGTVTLNGTTSYNLLNGVRFSTGSSLEAASYSITGRMTANSGGSVGSGQASGVMFVGTTSLKSTSTVVASTVTGTTSSTGGMGVMFYPGTHTLDAGTGTLNVESSSTSVAGVRSGWGGNSTINTKGNVTLGSHNSTASQTVIQGIINAQSGTLTIKGKSTSDGLDLRDGGGQKPQFLATNGANLVFNGISTSSGSGINMGIANGANVRTDTGSIELTGLSSTGQGLTIQNDTQFISTNGGSITFNADTLLLNPTTANISTSGTVAFKTNSGNAISLGGSDTTNATPSNRVLGLSQAELDRITSGELVIGSISHASNISVANSITTPATTGNVTLQTGGNIAVNAALTIGGVTGTKNLTLNGAGASSTVTQTAPITATSLSLLGANAAHTLTNASNSVANLSANTGSLTLTNSSDLTVNAINASGTIRLESEADLDVTQTIATTNTTATAATLIAGKSTATGTATGGNITFSGAGAISVGSGGRATLYTGSIAGSTGLGILAGFSRFNSSASSSGYTTALGSGTYAIYREAPTVTGTIANVSKTYDGQTYTGGYTAAYSGFANNDTSAQLSGISYGGAAIAAVNAGNHTISGTASNGLGYTVSYTNGTLTIDPKDITATYTAAHKTYDGSATASITNTTTGLIAGDAASLTYTSASFADANAGTAKNVSIAGISLTGADASNYNLLNTSASASANILKKELSISGAIAADKVADGSTTATLTHLGTLSGFVSNETVLLSSLTGTFDTATAGTNKAVALSATLANGANGGLADNYALENTIIRANILAASGGGSNAKPAPIVPPKPMLPTQTTDANEGGGNGDGSGGSSGNPYLLMPANRPSSADRCTPNTLEDCLCETQESKPVEGLAICYQPKKTAAHQSQGKGA